MRLGLLARVVVLGMVGLASACSSTTKGGGSTPGRDGVIAAILPNTPSDVQCLELNVMSADKSVTIQTA